MRFGNNELPPSYLKEHWADAHHGRIIISDSSNLQNEKHMEMEALKNKFLNIQIKQSLLLMLQAI